MDNVGGSLGTVLYPQLHGKRVVDGLLT